MATGGAADKHQFGRGDEPHAPGESVRGVAAFARTRARPTRVLANAATTDRSDSSRSKGRGPGVGARVEAIRRDVAANGLYYRVWLHLREKGLISRPGDRAGLVREVERITRRAECHRRRTQGDGGRVEFLDEDCGGG